MSRRRHDGGPVLVAFALIVPIFLMLLFALMDFGRVVFAQQAITQGAREGARAALVAALDPTDKRNPPPADYYTAMRLEQNATEEKMPDGSRSKDSDDPLRTYARLMHPHRYDQHSLDWLLEPRVAAGPA